MTAASSLSEPQTRRTSVHERTPKNWWLEATHAYNLTNKEDSMNKEVVIIEENWIKSVIKDVFTFGMFAGLMYFNHVYLSGNWFIDVLFMTCVILFLLSRNSKSVHRFNNREEAVKWLTKDKEQL